MAYEYTRYGNGFVRREADSTDPWQDVPLDDYAEAAQALVREGRGRRGRKVGMTITRAPENEAIAADLGMTADELADRLVKPDQNQGTESRLTEAEFDDRMRQLGLDPQEARDRFSGKHWRNS